MTVDDHRKQMISLEEKDEALCGHLDKCGTMIADRLTFNLQAKNYSPLNEGVLVLCIGGGPPPNPPVQFQKVFHTNNMRFELPATAVFPHCASGAVTSVKVDGHPYNLSEATHWKNKADIIVKCGSFSLHKKNAGKVAIEGPCGVTHLFAF